MYKAVPVRSVFFNMLVVAVVLFLPHVVWGQEISNTTVASPIVITGDIRDGDIVSYDPAKGIYRQSEKYADDSMFGVVVEDPVLYMIDEPEKEGAHPVVRAGEATVNVSTLGDVIHPGDLITASRIQGYGQRADRDSVAYVLGFALEAMTINDSIEKLVIDGMEVEFGRVRVALRIGSHVPGDLDEEIRSFIASSTLMAQMMGNEDGSGFDAFKAFRFILGALVALTAIFIALRRFGDTFAESVVSVGRNPLARSQIRSVLLWNALLIFIVSSVGLVIGAAIILVP